MIGIVDYGMGNLRSVQKAFEHLGTEARILTAPEQLLKIDRLVLPGVGAFGDGMLQLAERGLIEPIHDFLATGRPFLGICLGLQLLFECSQEDALSPDEPVRGLGVLPGRVMRFQGEAFGPGRLKVPHMGWNRLDYRADDPLFAGQGAEPSVYFVHSYYAEPADPSHVSASTDYGFTFCSAVRRGPLAAVQFHPEKSQRVGLTMLARFAGMH